MRTSRKVCMFSSSFPICLSVLYPRKVKDTFYCCHVLHSHYLLEVSLGSFIVVLGLLEVFMFFSWSIPPFVVQQPQTCCSTSKYTFFLHFKHCISSKIIVKFRKAEDIFCICATNCKVGQTTVIITVSVYAITAQLPHQAKRVPAALAVSSCTRRACCTCSHKRS